MKYVKWAVLIAICVAVIFVIYSLVSASAFSTHYKIHVSDDLVMGVGDTYFHTRQSVRMFSDETIHCSHNIGVWQCVANKK